MDDPRRPKKELPPGIIDIRHRGHDLQLTDELFTQTNLGTINPSAMHRAIAMGLLPHNRVMAQIDEPFKKAIKMLDVNQERVDRVVPNDLVRYPPILIEDEEHNHYLVDGAHRVTWCIQKGWSEFPAYCVQHPHYLKYMVEGEYTLDGKTWSKVDPEAALNVMWGKFPHHDYDYRTEGQMDKLILLAHENKHGPIARLLATGIIEKVAYWHVAELVNTKTDEEVAEVIEAISIVIACMVHAASTMTAGVGASPEANKKLEQILMKDINRKLESTEPGEEKGK